MLFNTIDFAVFLPIIFILYWFVVNKNILRQNLLIAISSYIFYGWWDWRFLSLIAFSTAVDYVVGNQLSITKKKNSRKLLLFTSVFVNLGFLAFFKYYNFFLENFVDAFSFFGHSINTNSLNIILPVGISFYTFQTLSYTIDIYKNKIKPSKDIVSFAAFVSFFPQLVAGPIERAKNLLPQFYQQRKFDYYNAVDGMRQILWGLFKKIVIADNCAVFADHIFNNYPDYSGSTLVLGAIFFTFQIYGDFSGYSDIAIGTARLFGFNLMQNFAFPYFSRDIAEFWRRWHISLSTWFRDYLYIPLGGSRGTNYKKIRNVFIIFLVSGFWHGANWTFIIWGALNALYFLPIMLLKRNRVNTDTVAKDSFFPSIKELVSMIITFSLTVLAWVFFRSESVNDAFAYLFNIIDVSLFTLPDLITPKIEMVYTLFCILILLLFEWMNREKKYALDVANLSKPNRWCIYFIVILMIITFGVFNQNTFIYFQF
jgi:alginate O-acetyltransferase complex protein AlgI